MRKSITVIEILMVILFVSIFTTISSQTTSRSFHLRNRNLTADELNALRSAWKSMSRDVFPGQIVAPHNNGQGDDSGAGISPLIVEPNSVAESNSNKFYVLDQSHVDGWTEITLTANQKTMWKGPYVNNPDEKRLINPGIVNFSQLKDFYGENYRSAVVLKSEVSSGQFWGWFLISIGNEKGITLNTTTRINLLNSNHSGKPIIKVGKKFLKP